MKLTRNANHYIDLSKIKFYTSAIMLGLSTLIVFSTDAKAQGSLSLEQCYIAASEYLPLNANTALIDQSGALQVELLDRKNFPEMQLFGQIQYQSDVTAINLDIPIPGFSADFPVIPNDQYRLGLEINQLIWDGGIISANKEIIRLKTQLEKKSILKDKYAQRYTINEMFFGILETESRIEALGYAISDLSNKKEQLQIMLDNGIILRSDIDNISAELLKIERNLDELKNIRQAFIAMLKSITGLDMSQFASFALPEVSDIEAQLPIRPEYELFELTKSSILASSAVTDTELMPKIGAYGQAFIARPGLNMFDDAFSGNWLVGIRASWKFWNWEQSNIQKQIYELNAQQINTQQRYFDYTLESLLAKANQEISKLENMILRDSEIIALKEKVLADTDTRLKNGTLTSTEYLFEFNDLNRAKTDMEIHKIKLVKAHIDLLTLSGKSN